MKILVLGINGMLGHIMFKKLFEQKWSIYGTLRNKDLLKYFSVKHHANILKLDKFDDNKLENIFNKIKPDILLNCICIVKQRNISHEPYNSIFYNAFLPHKLYELCDIYNCRLIHFSTDCVFSGKVGMYREDNISDATELYGRTKFLGEVHNKKAITLRTSFIGHEIENSFGLLEWFLKQEKICHGFTKAIYSGLSTTEISRVVIDYVIPRTELSGIYNLSSEPITKYDLLNFLKVYNKDIDIIKSEKIIIDRSLEF